MSDFDKKSASSLTMQALDRMILSVREDIRVNSLGGNDATVNFLQGEMKGYQNALYYLSEAVAKATPSAGVPKWIAVKDEMPPRNTAVLLYCGELTSTGYYDRSTGWEVDADTPHDGAHWVPSHWMPLPSAPNAELSTEAAPQAPCNNTAPESSASAPAAAASSHEAQLGIITAEQITTHEQLEAAYQQAIRGRHISEIAPVLALRNAALDALSSSTVPMPEGLHPETAALVLRFAGALAEKLRKAEVKYGYSDFWKYDDWREECQAKLAEHMAKGDPRDVANYCAFMWFHGWSTIAATSGKHCDADIEEAFTSIAPVSAIAPRAEYDSLEKHDDLTLYKALYHELLFAVANKYPDETRHETALRYIRQAESNSGGPCSATMERKSQ